MANNSLLWIIVGLGNPGREYENTRHNAGFLVLDRILTDKSKQSLHQAPFRSEKKFSSEIAEISIAGGKLLLVKPQTFMNLSGAAVLPLMQFYKVPSDNLIVIHDELDIRLGEVKLKQGGGSGGHNGIKSIDGALPSNNYFRVRVGIGKPSVPGVAEEQVGKSVVTHVLEAFNSEENKVFNNIVGDVGRAAEIIANDGMPAALKYLSAQKSKRIQALKAVEK